MYCIGNLDCLSRQNYTHKKLGGEGCCGPFSKGCCGPLCLRFYRRMGFDCEILLIVIGEFFDPLQSKDRKKKNTQ